MKYDRVRQWTLLAVVLSIMVASCYPPQGVVTPDSRSEPTVIGQDMSTVELTSARPFLTKDFDAQVPITWFDLAYQLVRDEKLVPPVAARLFGYTGVALYEAVAPGMPGYQSLAGQLNGLKPLPRPDPKATFHWPAVANAAIAVLFDNTAAGASAETQRAIADQKQWLDAQFALTVAPDVLQRSVAYGTRVGQAVFDWAMSDGIADLNNCAYTLPGGPGQWEPTPPKFAQALQPCWGQMRPFILRDHSEECQPNIQPTYSEETASQFYREALEVYQTVNNLTPEQQEIARLLVR